MLDGPACTSVSPVGANGGLSALLVRPEPEADQPESPSALVAFTWTW